MTVKIDSAEPNVFPVVEKLDVHDAGRGVTLTLATKIDGHLVPVSVHLDYRKPPTWLLNWSPSWRTKAAIQTDQLPHLTLEQLVNYVPVPFRERYHGSRGCRGSVGIGVDLVVPGHGRCVGTGARRCLSLPCA